MKKISLFFVLTLVLTVLEPVQAQEAPFPEGLLYEVINGRSIRITDYIGDDTSVIIPASIDGLPVKVIGKWAFSSCFELTNVTIPSSVTTIEEYAFTGCRGFTNITIPSSVTAIEPFAFFGCTNLTSVAIPSSVTTIGRAAFYDCSNLTDISVDQRNSVYISVSGVLFDKSGKMLICYPAGKRGAYTIPSSVTTIGIFAFGACRYLAGITIPVSVITIKEYAFSNCHSLMSVAIPDFVTVIEGWTFANCYELASVTIPSSVTAIGREAFSKCKLTSITLSKNTMVSGNAFDTVVQIKYRD